MTTPYPELPRCACDQKVWCVELGENPVLRALQEENDYFCIADNSEATSAGSARSVEPSHDVRMPTSGYR